MPWLRTLNRQLNRLFLHPMGMELRRWNIEYSMGIGLPQDLHIVVGTETPVIFDVGGNDGESVIRFGKSGGARQSLVLSRIPSPRRFLNAVDPEDRTI